MSNPSRTPSGQPVGGEWVKQQRGGMQNQQDKQARETSSPSIATDDDPTSGDEAQKRREKMQQMEKAEGDER